ncbi:MAG: hypothetical protein WC756_16605 [Taibaiella sp.]|jgi:hypothetical protein
MEDKIYYIEQYKKLKELKNGKKPLYKEFLAFCKSPEMKFQGAFGSNAYTKLQQECGDNPNKLQLERTPITDILDQYGQLVRANNKIPVRSDWVYAKLKPLPDGISKVHGIKWSAMPITFLKEYGNKPEWSDVNLILKGTDNVIKTVKSNKVFDEIVERLENWKPDRKRVLEEGYKIELRNYLEKFFNLEEEVGESNPDLLINNKFPIEVKRDPSQSEYDRLLGQMIRHNKLYGSAIAIVTNISSEDRFKKFQKIFIEIHDKLGMTAELLNK